ncbi:MAG TPA: hypothetical protein VGC99_20495, partial [Candidatus Tectomicrobia bacterium]
IWSSMLIPRPRRAGDALRISIAEFRRMRRNGKALNKGVVFVSRPGRSPNDLPQHFEGSINPFF